MREVLIPKRIIHGHESGFSVQAILVQMNLDLVPRFEGEKEIDLNAISQVVPRVVAFQGFIGIEYGCKRAFEIISEIYCMGSETRLGRQLEGDGEAWIGF